MNQKDYWDLERELSRVGGFLEKMGSVIDFEVLVRHGRWAAFAVSCPGQWHEQGVGRSGFRAPLE